MSDPSTVWTNMRALVHERYDRRKEVSEALGMSFIRIKALGRLAASGPMRQRQLSDELMIDRPYTTLVVDDLVRRGLAERSEDPGDRRCRIVSLTEEGVAVAARAAEIMAQPPEPVRDLSAEDLAALDRIVSQLLAGSPE
jgi:DNA-binding MarR family transcriptional regulator